jgi:hypothetical protein
VTKEKVLQLVREQLQNHRPGGVTLDAVAESIRQQDEYWYVPVLPSAQPPRMFEYYEALAEIESTLEESEQLQVWLVPVVPEEETTPPSEKAAT